MALELTTDGNTQTSTTGDTQGNMLGKHTESVQGSLLGWYLAFTRIVTGVAIDIVGGVSVNIFAGHKFVIQDGKCTTVGKLTDTKVMTTVMQDFGALTAKIADRNQVIETSSNNIITLTETGTTRTIDYDINSTSGDISTEEWTAEKNIKTGSYLLNCEEIATISVDGIGMIVTPSGVGISGPLIEIGE